MMKLKEISDSQKKDLGLLIKIWRNENGLTQDALLTQNGIKICSRTTLSLLENRKIIKDDIIYYSILKRMNIHFSPSNQFYNWIFDNSAIFLDSFINYDTDLFNQLFLQIESQSESSSQFYYNEYYLLIFHLHNLLSGKSSLKTKEYHHLLGIIDIFPEELKILCIHLCFLYCFRELEAPKEICNFMPLLSIYDNILIRIDLYRLYSVKLNFTELANLQDEITESLSDKKYPYLYMEFSTLKLRIIDLIHTNKKEETIKLLIDELKTNKHLINKISFEYSLSNLAMALYSSYNNFINSKKLFETLMITDNSNYNFYFLFWIDCCERLSLPIKNDMFKSISNTNSNSALTYFQLKYVHKKSIDYLIDYIMSSILPDLAVNNSKLIYNIFKYQLYLLIYTSATKRYKDYFDFCNISNN